MHNSDHNKLKESIISLFNFISYDKTNQKVIGKVDNKINKCSEKINNISLLRKKIDKAKQIGQKDHYKRDKEYKRLLKQNELLKMELRSLQKQ